MGVQGLAEELKEEYGPNVSVTEDPAVGTPQDPPSDATPQGEGTPPATAEGEPTAAGAQPAAEGPGEPQPASTEPSKGDDPEEDPAPESKPDEITPEQAKSFQEWEERITENAVTKIREEEIPNIQRGLDNRISGLRDENTTLQSELDEANQQIREESIKTLTPEEQESMRTGWASEDKMKELDSYSQELDDWHLELAANNLLTEYSQYGVTVESLEGLDFAEGLDPVTLMTDYCKDQKIEFLEKGATNGAKPETTEVAPATAAQPSPSSPEQKPPAGSKAPSDAGGGGVPPAPVEEDEGKGIGAMGNNVADHGWETADKAFAQPGR